MKKIFLFTILFAIAGCAELQFSSEVVKELSAPDEGQKIHADRQERLNFYGNYKVGNPYEIKGKTYYPQEYDEFREEGIASWYGEQFHGKATANGAVFDMNKVSAAHRTLPLPSIIRVTNMTNGKVLDVVVNDRGPFAKDRVLDMSKRGAELLGYQEQGVTLIRIELLVEKTAALHKQLYQDRNIANNDDVNIGNKPRKSKNREPLPKPAPRADVASIDLGNLPDLANNSGNMSTPNSPSSPAPTSNSNSASVGGAAASVGDAVRGGINVGGDILRESINAGAGVGGQISESVSSVSSAFSGSGASSNTPPVVNVPPVMQPSAVTSTVNRSSSTPQLVSRSIAKEVAESINRQDIIPNIPNINNAPVVNVNTPEDIINADIINAPASVNNPIDVGATNPNVNVNTPEDIINTDLGNGNLSGGNIANNQGLPSQNNVPNQDISNVNIPENAEEIESGLSDIAQENLDPEALDQDLAEGENLQQGPADGKNVTVEVGAFGSYQEALKAQALLSDIGEVNIEQILSSDGIPLFRVNVGSYDAALKAQEILKTVQKSGFQDATIVALEKGA